MSVRGPGDQDRVTILGRTGSGKSQFAIALLGTRDWELIPWIIIDYKGEDLLREIMLATGSQSRSLKGGAIKLIEPEDPPPYKPGLYYMQPRIGVDDDAVNLFLYRCYDEFRGPFGKRKRRGHIGIYIDEGYALPDKVKGPFDQILVQGRTLYIPVIALYQRPVWMTRFAIAQANFFAVFDQTDRRDWKHIEQFIRPPLGSDGSIEEIIKSLPPYYCLWYDVGRGITTILEPASARQVIVNSFVNRLSRFRRPDDGGDIVETKRALV